jgi:DNA-binding MarR family transcriptional regulator
VHNLILHNNLNIGCHSGDLALTVSEKNLKLENQLCFALYAASLAMSKAYKPHLDRLGLTYPQYLVMLVLWESDLQTVSEIGDRLFLDSGTLTPLLKRLANSGWVHRMRDKSDERRVLISLTPLGKQLKRKVLPLPQQMLEATQCSRSNAMRMAQDLKELRQSLKEQLP